jgi:O-antigen ligase
MIDSKYSVYILFFLLDLLFIPLSVISGAPSRLSILIFIICLTVFTVILGCKLAMNYVALLEITLFSTLMFLLFRLWQNMEFLVSFVYLIFLPGLLLSVNYKIKSERYLLCIIALFCVAACFFIVVPTYNHEGIRILVGTDNNIWFGRLVALTSLCIIFVFGDRLSLIIIFILLTTVSMLYISDARGALLSFIISTLVYFFSAPKKIYIILAMIFPLAVVTSSLLLGDFLDSQNDFSNLERLKLYIFSFNGIIDSPILGHGPGSFEKNYWDEDVKYPHNIFLEISYEYGFITCLLFFFFLLKITPICEKTDFSLLIFFLANASFSGNLFGNFHLFILFLSIIKQRKQH